MTDKFIVKTNSKEKIIGTSEVTQIYHAVKHNLSYSSLEFILKLKKIIKIPM